MKATPKRCAIFVTLLFVGPALAQEADSCKNNTDVQKFTSGECDVLYGYDCWRGAEGPRSKYGGEEIPIFLQPTFLIPPNKINRKSPGTVPGTWPLPDPDKEQSKQDKSVRESNLDGSAGTTEGSIKSSETKIDHRQLRKMQRANEKKKVP